MQFGQCRFLLLLLLLLLLWGVEVIPQFPEQEHEQDQEQETRNGTRKAHRHPASA